MNEWINEDELSESDLAFLEALEDASGESANPAPEGIIIEAEDGAESDEDGVIIDAAAPEVDDRMTEVNDDAEGDEEGEGPVDESKMDISDIETGPQPEGESKSEPDHLEGGDDEDSEIQDGEDELDYDDLDYEADEGELGDYSDSDDDELTKIEEDDGEGERGNSDEARESDEPIKSGDEPKADAEDEADDDFDAQKELEDHLRDEDSDSDDDGPEDEGEADHDETPAPPHDDDESDAEDDERPRDEDDKSDPEEDRDDEPRGDVEPESPDPDSVPESGAENPEDGGEERPEGAYAAIPEAGDRCTNHCEDNPDSDEDSDEECPHCKERIRIEREQWGAVALDMRGNPLLPGDKVRVAVPHPNVRKDSILTVNVPNMEIEDPRFIESTAGEHRLELCWLSGHGISKFTGWHMEGSGNPVWKFEKGTNIDFVEKIAQPEFEDIDPEKMIEDFMKDLDEHGAENQKDEDDKPEPDAEETPEDDERPEPDEDEDYEGEDDDDELKEKREEREKERERAGRDELTKAQHDRFDNLVDRIDKKIEGTFGGTMESHAAGEARHNHVSADQTIVIVSRGVEYTVSIKATRHHGSESGEAA